MHLQCDSFVCCCLIYNSYLFCRFDWSRVKFLCVCVLCGEPIVSRCRVKCEHSCEPCMWHDMKISRTKWVFLANFSTKHWHLLHAEILFIRIQVAALKQHLVTFSSQSLLRHNFLYHFSWWAFIFSSFKHNFTHLIIVCYYPKDLDCSTEE